MPRTSQYLNSLAPKDEADFRNLEEGADFLFTFHPWSDDKIEKSKEVKEALKQAYIAIIKNVPPSPTRTVALRNLTEARMNANMAITFDGAF